MKLTFRQLQVFRIVAQTGNFTNAANQLYLSQPAVSIQVKQLEQQVGLALFEHVSGKLMLTAAGKILLNSAQKINYQLQELEQNLTDLLGLKSGHLELAVVSTANAFSTKLLADFVKHYPGVTFSLNVCNRNEIVNLLKLGNIDLAIMGYPPEKLKALAVQIMANPLLIVAPANHHLTTKKRILLSDLSNEPFVVRETGSGTRHVLTGMFSKANITFSPRLVFSSAEAIKDAVLAGLGLALVSKFTINQELTKKSLVALPVIDTPIIKHWHLVSTRKLSPIAARFHDFILDEAVKIN